MAIIHSNKSKDADTHATKHHANAKNQDNLNNVLERLDSAINRKTPTNRSADLVPLRQSYEAMRGRLTHIIQYAKKYDESMETMDNARMQTAGTLSDLLRDTPLEESGQKNTMLNQRLSNKNKEMKMRYRVSVIEHMENLHKTLSIRIDSEEKEIEKLSQTLKHYTTKVDKLREKTRSKEANPKKEVSERKASKLTRNEDKLGKAWRQHEATTSRHCDLLEEITKHGWKDLYKIVSNMFSFEKEFGEQHHDITKEFAGLSESAAKIYNDDMEVTKNLPVALHDPDAKKHAEETVYADESSISSSSSSSVEAIPTPVTK